MRRTTYSPKIHRRRDLLFNLSSIEFQSENEKNPMIFLPMWYS